MLRSSVLRRGRVYRYRYRPTAIRTKVQSNQIAAEYNSKVPSVFGDIKSVAKDLFLGRGQFSTLHRPFSSGTQQSTVGVSDARSGHVSRSQYTTTSVQHGQTRDMAPSGTPAASSTQAPGQSTSEAENIAQEHRSITHGPPAKDALTQPSASDLMSSSLATMSRLEITMNPDPNRIMNSNPIYHNSFPNIHETYMSPSGIVKLDTINSVVKSSLQKLEPVTQYLGPLAQVSYLTAIAIAGRALDFTVEPLSKLWSNAYGKGYVRTIIPEAEPSGGPQQYLRMRELKGSKTRLSTRDRQLLEHEPENYLMEARRVVDKAEPKLSEKLGHRHFSTVPQGRSGSEIPSGSGAIPPFSRNVGLVEEETAQGMGRSTEWSQSTNRDPSIQNVPGQVYSKPSNSSDPKSRQLSGIEYTSETIRAPESSVDKDWKPGMPYVRSPTAMGESYVETLSMGPVGPMGSVGSVGTGALGVPNLERDMHQPANVVGGAKLPTSTGSSTLSGTVIGRPNTRLAWLGYVPKVDAHGHPIPKEPVHYTIREYTPPRHSAKRVDIYARKDSTPHSNPFAPLDALEAPLSVRFSHVDGHIPSSHACIHDIAKNFPAIPEFDAVRNIRTDILLKAGTKSHHPRHFEGKTREQLHGITTQTHLLHLQKKHDFADKHASWSVAGLSLQDIIAPDNIAKAGTRDYKLSDHASTQHISPHARTREAVYDPKGDLRFGAPAASKAGTQTVGESSIEVESVSLRPPEHGLKEDLTKTEGYYRDLEDVVHLGPQSIREIEMLGQTNPELLSSGKLHPMHAGNIPPEYREAEKKAKRRTSTSASAAGVRRDKGVKSPKKSPTSQSRRHFSTATPVLSVGKAKRSTHDPKIQIPRSDAYFTEYQFRVLAAALPDLEEHETDLYATAEEMQSPVQEKKAAPKKRARKKKTETMTAEATGPTKEGSTAPSKAKTKKARSPKHSEYAIHTEHDKDRVQRMGNEYGKGYGYGNGQGVHDAAKLEYEEYGLFSYNALEPEDMHQYALMEKEKEKKKSKAGQSQKNEPSRYSKEAEVLRGISDTNLRNVSKSEASPKKKKVGQPSQEELHAEYTESSDNDWIGDINRESVRHFSPNASAFDSGTFEQTTGMPLGTTSSSGHSQAGTAAPRRGYHTATVGPYGEHMGRSHFHTSPLSHGSSKRGIGDKIKDQLYHHTSIEDIASEEHKKPDTSLPRYMQSKTGQRVGFYSEPHTQSRQEPGDHEGHYEKGASDEGLSKRSGKHGKVEQGLTFDPETKTWWRRRPDGGEEFAYYGEYHSDPSDPSVTYQRVSGKGAYGPNYLNLSSEEIIMQEYPVRDRQPRRERDQTKDANWSKEGQKEGKPWYESGFVSDRVPHLQGKHSDDVSSQASGKESQRTGAAEHEPLSAERRFYSQEEFFMTGSRIDFHPEHQREGADREWDDTPEKQKSTPHVEPNRKGRGIFSKPETVTGSRQYHTSAIAFSAADKSRAGSRQPKLSPLPAEYIATEDFSGGYGAPWQPGRGPLNLDELTEPEDARSAAQKETQSKPLTPQYHIFDDGMRDMGRPRRASDESREEREKRKKRVVSMLNPLLQNPRSIVYGVPTDRDQMRAPDEYVTADRVEYVGRMEEKPRPFRRRSRFARTRSRGTSFRELLRGATGESEPEEPAMKGKPSHHTAKASESREIRIGDSPRRPIPDSTSRVAVHPHQDLEEELQSHFHAVEMWHDRSEKESNRRIDPVTEHRSFDGFTESAKPKERAAFDTSEDGLLETPVMPHANEEGFLIDDSDREPRNARLVHREDVRPPSWMPQTPRASSSYSLPRSTLSGKPTETLQYGKHFYSIAGQGNPRPLPNSGLFRFFQPKYSTSPTLGRGIQRLGSDARAHYSIFLASHEDPVPKSTRAGKKLTPEATDYLHRIGKDLAIEPTSFFDKILVREPMFSQSRNSYMASHTVESGPAGSYTHYNEDDDHDHLTSLRDGHFVKVYPAAHSESEKKGWDKSASSRNPESVYTANGSEPQKYGKHHYPLESFSSSELRNVLFRSRRSST